ncbi:pilus assembly protein [Qipengyuania sp. 1NDH17]|uniref:Pilus assembly protein n=1 Tax=Qipengyuania polymorpha TaxID=2867234 RepID=A0ABS7IZA4_9SPHN|nr:TadE/TadG family type IV pilus assembly protein [Qipengyuania polymorpha]MBX7457405.1 pilus assembly protein [Qipengyuania polymorpha]
MSVPFCKRLAGNEQGSTIVEFAILAPVFFGIFFGLIQIGISMQAYNSIRGVASDTARWAVVEYMNQREPTDSDIQDKGIAIAQAAPYMLNDSIDVVVTPVATTRIHGTHERTMTITYTPPDVLPFFDFVSKEQKFERPIFMIDE